MSMNVINHPLNKRGGLRHNLPKAYDAAIKKVSKRLSSLDNSSPLRITEPELVSKQFHF